MGVTDWKARAQAAEAALQLARKSVPITPERRALLAALGDVVGPQAWLSTPALARRLGWTSNRTRYVAKGLTHSGLVEQDAPGHGGRGAFVAYRLGYLVQVPE